MKFVALFVAASLTGSALGQTTRVWSNPAGGNWNTAANWQGGVIPSSPTDLAELGGTTTYSVLLDASPSLGGLTISNWRTTLNIPGLQGLVVRAPSGQMTLNGRIVVNSDFQNLAAGLTKLRFIQDCTINGDGSDGTIRLNGYNGFPRPATLETSNTATLTLTPNITVFGSGRVTGNIINGGTIQSAPNEYLELFQLNYTQATGGRIVSSGSGSQVQVNGGTFEGARFSTASGGVVVFAANTQLNNCSLSGDIRWGANGVTVSVGAGGLTLGAGGVPTALSIYPGGCGAGYLTFTANATLGGTGSVVPDGCSATTSRIIAAPGTTLTIGPGITFRSYGAFEGNVIFQGTLVPGYENFGPQYSECAVLGTLTLDSMSTYKAKIRRASNGALGSTQLKGPGTKILGGTLIVAVEPATDLPTFGNSFPIVTEGPIFGGFASYQLPPRRGLLTYGVRQEAGAFSVYATCVADLVRVGGGNVPDGLFTADDVIAFIRAFISGDPRADITGVGGATVDPDGQLTADDLVLFLRLFFNNCSSI